MEELQISEGLGLGAGLGAIGFWLFIAAVVVAGIWFYVRKREAEHETLRRMIESDKPLDPILLDKLLSASGSGSKHLDRDLKLSGLILLFIAPGLALLGVFVGQEDPKALLPLLGVGALVACVSAGLLVTGKMIGRWRREDDAHKSS